MKFNESNIFKFKNTKKSVVFEFKTKSKLSKTKSLHKQKNQKKHQWFLNLKQN